MALFAEITENEGIIKRHLRDVDPLYDLLRGVRFDWSSQLVTGTNIVYMTEIIRHDALRWSEILVLR